MNEEAKVRSREVVQDRLKVLDDVRLAHAWIALEHEYRAVMVLDEVIEYAVDDGQLVVASEHHHVAIALVFTQLRGRFERRLRLIVLTRYKYTDRFILLLYGDGMELMESNSTASCSTSRTIAQHIDKLALGSQHQRASEVDRITNLTYKQITISATFIRSFIHSLESRTIA